MNDQDSFIRFYLYCARHFWLRPIYRLLRFLQPLIITHKRISKLVSQISQDPGLPSEHPTEAFWQIPPHAELSTIQSPVLKGRVDVVIIGSGITAASIAHHLLTNDPNITVTVLEARTLCSGATGRNGGHIVELPYEDYEEQVSLFGREAAKELVRFRLGHLGEILEFSKSQMSKDAAEYCEIRTVETVDSVFDEQQWIHTQAQFRSFLTDFPELDGIWRLWDGQEAKQKFALPDIFGAITGPAGAIWPYRFVTSVFESLLLKYSKRLSIETQTPALRIETMESCDHPYLVVTPRGSVSARHIVHASNGHVSHLLPRMRGKLFPIRGQMTVQAAGSGGLDLGSERSWLLKHGKGFDYMTRNAQTGDYFLGGGIFQGGNGGLDDIGNKADDEQNFLSICHLTGLLSIITRPLLGDKDTSPKDRTNATLKSAWSGVMGFSCDGIPWVGKLPDCISDRRPQCTDVESTGEWIAAGFCGSGMVYCWRSGQAIAAMIRNEKVSGWFPECMLPTGKRFKSASAEDIAIHFFSMTN